MSHTTTINSIEIKDVAAMKAAVADLKAKGLKCDLIENATPRMYSRGQEAALGNCEYVLKLHDGKYDVGFKKQANGTYAPVLDDWNGYVSSQLGAACPVPGTAEGRAQHSIGQFMEGYTKHAIMNTAKREGRSIRNVGKDKNGNMVVTIAGF